MFDFAQLAELEAGLQANEGDVDGACPFVNVAEKVCQVSADLPEQSRRPLLKSKAARMTGEIG